MILQNVSCNMLPYTNSMTYRTRWYNVAFTKASIIPILSRINAIPLITTYFFKIHSNIVLISISSSEGLFPIVLYVSYLIYISILELLFDYGLWNPEVQCRIHKSSLIIPIVGRINRVPRIDTYFFMIHSNIVLPPPPSPS